MRAERLGVHNGKLVNNWSESLQGGDVRETEDRWRGIIAKVAEESPGSRRYHVDFRVASGAYPELPSEARVIIERVADGELRVAQYSPPECETPGESSTDWQALAVEAVQKQYAGIGPSNGPHDEK